MKQIRLISIEGGALEECELNVVHLDLIYTIRSVSVGGRSTVVRFDAWSEKCDFFDSLRENSLTV